MDFVLFYGGFGVLEWFIAYFSVLVLVISAENSNFVKNSLLFTLPIIHLVYISIFCPSLVFAFCWVERNTQETLKTILTPIFFLWGWEVYKVHYG